MANTEAKVRGFDSSQLRIFLTYNGSKREVGIISTDLNGSSAASGETFRTNSSPLETASTTRLIIRRISRVSCPNSFLRPTSGFLFHLNFNRKGLFYLFDIFRCHGGDRIGSRSDQRPKKKICDKFRLEKKFGTTGISRVIDRLRRIQNNYFLCRLLSSSYNCS